MKSPLFAAPRAAAALLLATASLGALAALQPGDPAPLFTTDAAVAGKAFAFDMGAALKKEDAFGYEIKREMLAEVV